MIDNIENERLRSEIVALRECLKDACNTELSCHDCKSPCFEYTQDDCPIKRRWRKVLEGTKGH